jgi:5-methylcytosine-specific restriction endonuclease McrA
VKLTKEQRGILFNMFGGRCAYCGHTLPLKGWHADHKEPILRKLEFGKDAHGRTIMIGTGECHKPHNDTIDNMFPSCAKCNIEKSSGSIEDFRNGLELKVDIMRRNNANWNHLERFGIIEVVKTKVVFYFERGAEQ